MASVEGTNQNEVEGVNLSAVFNSALANSGAGNQITAPWMIRSGKTFYLPLLYSIFSKKALRLMKRRADIDKRAEEALDTLELNWVTWTRMFWCKT